MASQARTILVLGAVLALGIAGAIWAVMSVGPEDAADAAAAKGGETAVASNDPVAKPSTGGGRRVAKGTALIVGEVRRSKGKVPVADQEVQLLPEKGQPFAVKTDATGAFKLTDLPHGGPYELRVESPGCGTIRIPGIALDRNEKRDVGTLWLDPAVRVTVEVKSWAADAVEGALVEAFAVAQAENFDWSKAYAQMGQTPVAVAKASTDAEGRVVFPELTTGRWSFVATKAGFARSGRSSVTVRSDVPPPPVKLFLGKGHSLSGKVADVAKAPVAGALVMAGPNNAGWDLGSAALRARTVTDAEGKYAFGSLDAGDVVLFVGRPNGGIPSAVATVRVPNVKEFDITLKGTGTVTGVVTEKEGGKPIEAATVRAWNWSNAGATVAEGTTDAEGKYSVTVTEGTVGSVVAEKAGWVSADDPTRPRPQMPLREGETQSRDLQLKPGAKVSGVVKGPDGPLPGAKVTVHYGTNQTGWQQKVAMTDAEGHYEAIGVPPGKAVVRADLGGWYVKDFPENYWQLLQGPATSPFKIDVAEGAATTKDLDMARGVPVEGRVEGPEGPLAGVRVASPQDFEGGVVTGADGTFRIESVRPSATTMLYATLDGYAATSANKPFPVTADTPVTGIVLKLARVGSVKGTVTASDGTPLVDARVTLTAWQERNDNQMMWTQNYNNGPGTAAPVRADGSYELPLSGIAGGKFRVNLTALDRPAAQSDTVPIVDGQSEYVVNFAVDGGKDLEGRVVAKQGGAGVAGALVSIQSRGTSRGGGGMMQMQSQGGGATVWAVADADGRFAVSHLTPGSYGVTANFLGYVTGSAQVDLATTTQVTVEMEVELTIEGVVMFGDGALVEGANLNAMRDQPAGGGAQPQGFIANSGNAVTGTGGRFRLTGLSAGNYKLRVSPDWSGELNIKPKTSDPIAAGSTGVKLVVDAGGVIAGRVLDPQKQPLGNIGVWANPEMQNGKRPEGVEGRAARTRQDGTFSISGLADGATFAVTVQVNQGWDQSGGSTLKNATLTGITVGTRNLEIVLEEGLTITGKVVNAEGKPVSNAGLTVQMTTTGPDGKSTSRQQRQAMIGSDGTFTVGGLEGGECSFELQDWNGTNQGLVIQNGDKIPAGTRDVQLVASKGLTITGSVVDETGSGLKQAGVWATPKNGGKNRGASTKDDGTFEITGLTAGVAYKVVANAPARPAGKADDVAANTSGLRLVLPKGLEASGRLFDADGSLLKQTQLIVHLTGDAEQRQNAVTDAEGNFKLMGLVDGIYEAECYQRNAKGGTQTKKCGTIRAGDSGADLKVVEPAK